MKKQAYIIVGDNNYWYATTEPITEKQLATRIKNLKREIAMGDDMFSPQPNADANELKAFPIGGEEKVFSLSETKEPMFNSGQLSFDIDKISSYDSPQIKKESYKTEGETTYTIEVNDESYLYPNKEERDQDFKELKSLLGL